MAGTASVTSVASSAGAAGGAGMAASGADWQGCVEWPHVARAACDMVKQRWVDLQRTFDKEPPEDVEAAWAEAWAATARLLPCLKTACRVAANVANPDIETWPDVAVQEMQGAIEQAAAAGALRLDHLPRKTQESARRTAALDWWRGALESATAASASSHAPADGVPHPLDSKHPLAAAAAAALAKDGDASAAGPWRCGVGGVTTSLGAPPPAPEDERDRGGLGLLLASTPHAVFAWRAHGAAAVEEESDSGEGPAGAARLVREAGLVRAAGQVREAGQVLWRGDGGLLVPLPGGLVGLVGVGSSKLRVFSLAARKDGSLGLELLGSCSMPHPPSGSSVTWVDALPHPAPEGAGAAVLVWGSCDGDGTVVWVRHGVLLVEGKRGVPPTVRFAPSAHPLYLGSLVDGVADAPRGRGVGNPASWGSLVVSKGPVGERRLLTESWFQLAPAVAEERREDSDEGGSEAASPSDDSAAGDGAAASPVADRTLAPRGKRVAAAWGDGLGGGVVVFSDGAVVGYGRGFGATPTEPQCLLPPVEEGEDDGADGSRADAVSVAALPFGSLPALFH